MIGRLKGAVADAAETLRRIFADPPCHRLEPGAWSFGIRTPSSLEARPKTDGLLSQAALGKGELDFGGHLVEDALVWRPVVLGEPALASWAAGARVLEMELFGAASGLRSEVPPLPRRAQVRDGRPEAFRPRNQEGFGALPRPRALQAGASLASPRTRRDLELAMGLPLAIQGEDPAALPRPVWMRYTLQIVKATGENIRNLDVLGLYRIPVKGVLSLRHDARSGRLVVQLGPEASGGGRSLFVLARRKDDRSIVSCYLEGG
nr:hypothetical protein [uncultured Holophaga sp.]